MDGLFVFAYPLGVIPVLPALAGLLPVLLAAIGGAIASLLKPAVLKAALKVLWRNKFVVVALAAAIYGLIQIKGYLKERLGRGQGAVMQSQTDWPAFRGGPDRRGSDLSGDDPVSGGPVWTFAREAKTFYASPALVGDSVFIASAEQGLFSEQGAIYRLDAASGEVVWRYMPKGYRATFSSPSYWARPATNGQPAKAYVVCGEGLHFTEDARIVCLSADTGEQLWALRTASHVESSPCVWNGKAYVGAGNDGFYCVELEPRDGKPRVVWRLDGKDYPDCEACPVVVDGKVYFSLGMGGMAVVCADAETGREIWRVNAPYPVFGNPTVVSNRVVIGMGNGNFVETAEQVRIKELNRLKERKAGAAEIAAADQQLSKVNGEVWCLDAQNGRMLWSNKVGRVILGSIAHADGHLYVGSGDGALSCFSLDGALLRSWNAHEPIKTSPAVGKEHVYFLTDGGRLYALDRKDFRRPVWECRIGTSGLFVSSPAVGSGHVYVGTAGSGFMCVGQPAGTQQDIRWLGHLGGPGKSGWADKTPPANHGRFAWRHPPGQDNPDAAATAAVARVSAPLAVGSNALFVAQQGARNGLLKLVPAQDRRRAPAEAGFYVTANGVYLSPALHSDSVYVVDGRPGDAGRKLHCLTAAGLTPLWSRDVAVDVSGESTLTADGKMLIYDRPGMLSFLDLDGAPAEIWSAPIGAPRGAPCESKGIVLAASESDSRLYALSAVNGGVLWKAALASPPRTGPVTDGDLVVVGTAEGIVAVGLVDGRARWSAACGPVSAPLVADSERLAGVTVGGLLAAYDWEGRELNRLEGALPGISPLLCGDSILFFMPEAIQRLDAVSGKSSVWLPRTGWLGKASAPGVLAEGFLYYGSESKGVVCVGQR